MKVLILEKKACKNCPVYFIADIAANHDGKLDKAIELIKDPQKQVLTLLNFNILKLKL